MSYKKPQVIGTVNSASLTCYKPLARDRKK